MIFDTVSKILLSDSTDIYGISFLLKDPDSFSLAKDNTVLMIFCDLQYSFLDFSNDSSRIKNIILSDNILTTLTSPKAIEFWYFFVIFNTVNKVFYILIIFTSMEKGRSVMR